jgi:hypothetical protein
VCERERERENLDPHLREIQAVALIFSLNQDEVILIKIV